MSSSASLLHGKKVVIFGGSSGIGKGVAIAALQNGASVCIASSSQAKVDSAVETLKEHIKGQDGATVSGRAVDMKDFVSLTSFLTKEALFDHFVTTAGESAGSMVGAAKADVDIQKQLEGSMECVLRLVYIFYQLISLTLSLRYWATMNAGGSIMMTIGVLQARPLPGFGFLLGVVGAVETATRSLAVDLKPIRLPGLVDTEMTQQYPEQMREQIFKAHEQKLLVGHVGTPAEVAEAYIFAMKCQYLTGQVITVDGGGVLV